MSYNPAQGGFAKYFFSMLDDADRNFKYGAAIKACIEEFTATEKRPPCVLDIGVGTGMLSALCLEHGAKHVTGVDVNPTMTALAKATLGEVDPTGKKWKVKLVKPGASQLGKAKYDMVVSEILGTLTTSESMFKYINLYTRHLKTFGGDGEGGGAAGGTPQRVYAVPRSTHQYFSVRSYDKAKLGAPLAAALEHATQSPEAARKLVPTNEGGIGLHLPLYESELIDKRLIIHSEHYDELRPVGQSDGSRMFRYDGLGNKTVTFMHEFLGDHDNRLNLGVFEWSVELWKGVHLENTIDFYQSMPLRNQLARGSAWGFFVTALPEIATSASAGGKPPSVRIRANQLNPINKATPEIIVDGERLGGNVCDTPLPYVTMAADTELAQKYVTALQAAMRTGEPGPLCATGVHRGADPTAVGADPPPAAEPPTEPPRLLIVNDISCGALPHACASLGYNVDVVNEEAALSVAGQEAYALQRSRPDAIVVASDADADADAAVAAVAAVATGKERRAKAVAAGRKAAAAAATLASVERQETLEGARRGRRPLSLINGDNGGDSSAHDDGGGPSASMGAVRGRCQWMTGRVDTEPSTTRKTRAIFVPSADDRPVYAAVLFPSAMLDAFQAEADASRRVDHANAICARWLLPGGVRLPASPATLQEKVVTLSHYSLYRSAIPASSLRLAGVEGALTAFGAPRAPPATDDGPSADGASADGTVACSGELFDTSDAGLAFHGFHAVELHDAGDRARKPGQKQKRGANAAASPSDGEDGGIAVGIVGVSVALQQTLSDVVRKSTRHCSTGKAALALALDWSVDTFQDMVRPSQAATVRRSAVARCLYQGVRVRLAREPKQQGAKKAKKAAPSANSGGGN